MSGLPDIDVDDWEKNTDYSSGYDEDSDIIKVRSLLEMSLNAIHVLRLNWLVDINYVI